MTQNDDDLSPQDQDDALAAEYVPGVLALPERRQAEARAKADPALAARITAWEVRLSHLNVGFAPVPAPNLLPALEARLFPVAAERPCPRFGWRFLGGAVAAAGLAAAVLPWQATPRPARPG